MSRKAGLSCASNTLVVPDIPVHLPHGSGMEGQTTSMPPLPTVPEFTSRIEPATRGAVSPTWWDPRCLAPVRSSVGSFLGILQYQVCQPVRPGETNVAVPLGELYKVFDGPNAGGTATQEGMAR